MMLQWNSFPKMFWKLTSTSVFMLTAGFFLGLLYDVPLLSSVTHFGNFACRKFHQSPRVQ